MILQRRILMARNQLAVQTITRLQDKCISLEIEIRNLRNEVEVLQKGARTLLTENADLKRDVQRLRAELPTPQSVQEANNWRRRSVTEFYHRRSVLPRLPRPAPPTWNNLWLALSTSKMNQKYANHNDLLNYSLDIVSNIPSVLSLDTLMREERT